MENLALAVVDPQGHFVGVIPPHRLVAVLLSEHEEDLSRFGGFLKTTSVARTTSEEPVQRRFQHRLPWLLLGLEDGCPDGETVDAVGARADRVIARIRACAGDVLLFAHRDMFRVLAARWLGRAAREGRYFYLATASVSSLGYHHDLNEPVVHLWNDARH